MSCIAIIIVNFNSWDMLAICLEKLELQTYRDFEVLVIDNASRVAMPEGFQERYAQVKFVCNTLNTGFAAANNQGINSLPEVEWCVLLNPDAFPEPDWLATLVSATMQYPDYDIFASRQLMVKDSQLLDGDGDDYFISGFARRRGYGKSVRQAQSGNREVFAACAAAGMYKTKALRAVNGFDEDYFCYGEDVDLGFRLRLAGYKCLLVANAVVEHVGSASTGGQHSDFAVYHGHRNLPWTFVKNMPGYLFWALLPLHLAMNIVTILLFTVRGQSAVIFRSKWATLRGLPTMWRKRRLIQSSRKVSIAEIWRVLDKSWFRL